ncbi:Uncharacterized alpha/beta hydrolase domain [Ruegeria halocynthiae]|uniref:Uncharacterized alpha/beta hydrolase domain n=1 Tax=Ruegeria halocynthiae TaxID=985054 RepID=A0A1H3CMB1_9RHOB|nr:DUF2235 domain-containing protein [Ruegeria halocynthiae]SDX55291.1 Uncharacterized alpha/beta hydrolase domain [Ruegeria halocynthiae]
MKKIVICCDGTGNEIRENQFNVLKFYRVLKESADQIGFYDPGVGTISNSGAWSRFKNQLKGVFGLATGYGLDANVLYAYRFLIRHFEDGDEVYLFGFSRGAHTVRVLAGFINMVGLLHPHQEHLCSYALTAYKQSGARDEFDVAWRVQEVLNTRRITIRFMGCWDTGASVIVPRPDRMYLPSLEALPYTQTNPCVRVFRHACAIDERRRMFRLSRWQEPQPFKTNPFVKDEDAEPQDIQQVWFAGLHGDNGSGYPEQESGAAKYPLAWMVDEARAHGLVFRETMVKRLVMGENPRNVRAGSKRDYAAPDIHAELHDSMTFWWRLLEYLPKRKKWHDNPEIRKQPDFYIPMKEPRFVPIDATLHPSVRERIDLNTGYKPENLP